jgi:hypothetical protein
MLGGIVTRSLALALLLGSVIAFGAASAAALEVTCLLAPPDAEVAPTAEEAACATVAVHVGESSALLAPGEHSITLRAQELAEALELRSQGFFTLSVTQAEMVLFEKGAGTSLQIFRSPQDWLVSACEAGGAQVSDEPQSSRFTTIVFPEGGGSCDFFFATVTSPAAPSPSTLQAAVPEPSTLDLLGLGMLALAGRRRVRPDTGAGR